MGVNGFFPPKGGLDHVWRRFWLSELVGGGCWPPPNDAAKHPITHRAAPEQRNPHVWVPKVNSAEVEIPSN